MEGWFRIITVAVVLRLSLGAPSSSVSEMEMHPPARSPPSAITIGATSDVTTIDVTSPDTSTTTTKLTPRPSTSTSTPIQSSSSTTVHVYSRTTPTTTTASSVRTSKSSLPPASSVPWKGMAFGFAGSTVLLIITTVVALVVLCRFKRRLGNASRTLYPVTSDTTDDGDNVLPDVDTSMYQPDVELRTINRLSDDDVMDSPFDPAPPRKPPRLSIIIKDSDAPPLPPGRRNRSVNSVTAVPDSSRPLDAAYDNEVVTKSADSKELLVSKEDDAHQEHNDIKPRKQILKKEESFGTDTEDVYETYDDTLFKRPNADSIEESGAYEDPVKSRTFTNTSEFIRRQSSLTGLPDMTLKVAPSENQFSDTPLQEAELTENEEIATLDDLTCYDDADVLDANIAPDVTKNQMYSDDEALYEDGDDEDEVPLYEDCDIEDPLGGIDNPLMLNTGLPLDLEMQSEPDKSEPQGCQKEQSYDDAEFTPGEDILIKHNDGPVYDNGETDFNDVDGIGHALYDDAMNLDVAESTPREDVLKNHIEDPVYGSGETDINDSGGIGHVIHDGDINHHSTNAIINGISTNDQYLRDDYGLGVSTENQANGFESVDEDTTSTSTSSDISEPISSSSSIHIVGETPSNILPIVPPRRDIRKETENRNNYDVVPPPRLIPGLSNDSIDATQGDTVLRPGKSIREVSGPRDSYFFDMVDELRDSAVINEIVPAVDTTVDDLMDDVPPGLGTPPVFRLGSDIDTTDVNGKIGVIDFDPFADENVYDTPPPRN